MKYAVRLVVVSVCIIVALSAGACSPFASKGTMPPPGLNGQVDASAVFAAAGDDDGIAGNVV